APAVHRREQAEAEPALRLGGEDERLDHLPERVPQERRDPRADARGVHHHPPAAPHVAQRCEQPFVLRLVATAGPPAVLDDLDPRLELREVRDLGDTFLAGRRAITKTGHNSAADIQAAAEAGRIDPGMTFAPEGPAGLV